MTIFVPETKGKINVDLKFTLPGKERQDSVYSGLQVSTQCFELKKEHYFISVFDTV